MINTVSQEAIIHSVEDSQLNAKVEVKSVVKEDEKDDMLRQLLKKVLNKEITIEEYKLLSQDVKEAF